ncbi:MAG: hypothetical protein E6G94_03635 [Alphaproteobacteria bacterium]|nr:MAG: hypothetical protein E6G94_03635 [Alphaproteobacteria bacterium]
MSGNQDGSGAPKHLIDDRAKGAFLAAIKGGALLRDAAAAAGFTLGAFWKERKRDPAFDEAVQEMLELSNLPRFIRPANGRPMQLRRTHRLRFADWRQEVFLAHFAATCNETAAAEAAGVCTATVYRARRRDPVFAAAHQAALEQSYVRLEAEALRQRLEAQRRLADVLDQGLDPGGALAEEFDRVMKLLARWDRGNGKVGPRTVSAARSDSMSFDEAIALLAHRLTGLGHRIPGYPALEAPPADEGGAAEADANGDGEDNPTEKKP